MIPEEATRDDPTDLEILSDAAPASAEEVSLAELFDPGRVPEQFRGKKLARVTGPDKRRKRSRRARVLLSLLATTGKFGIVAAVAWGLMFNFSEVRGSSMEPGIMDRDRILVDHVSYLIGDVERGDIVVMRYPLDPSLDYIKRVIGLPGDEVTIVGGEVWVNGEPLEEPYVADSSIDPFTVEHTVVQPEHFYVLGDNRLRSSDSREFGQVAREFLRGKVSLRVWPPARAGLLH